MHAINRDVLTYNISRNADLTYRLYDYGRVDPNTGEERELHIDKVLENVLVPDTSEGFVWIEPYQRNGCEITDYWDEPGLYSLSRIKTKEQGTYRLKRFAFITVVDGAGTVNEVPISKGETVLIPAGIEHLEFTGALDLFVASYKNKEA